MIMFNLTSVPSDLHAHPSCKVDSRAEERARRMLPQVKILDQTTWEFVIVFFSFSFISRKQKSSTGWNVIEIYITIRSKFTSIPFEIISTDLGRSPHQFEHPAPPLPCSSFSPPHPPRSPHCHHPRWVLGARSRSAQIWTPSPAVIDVKRSMTIKITSVRSLKVCKDTCPLFDLDNDITIWSQLY